MSKKLVYSKFLSHNLRRWSTILTIFFSLHLISCLGQETSFMYKPVPDKYLSVYSDTLQISYELQAKMLSFDAYDLVNSLPKGYKKDGSVDYTVFLQNGINSYKIVRFPDFPVLINKHGLRLKSGNTLVFPKNSLLLMEPNELENYSVLNIADVENVSLYFPSIKGDRDRHTGTKGEWGMGIMITGSKNINVFRPVISDCWGDGIYIGKGRDICRNINIYSARIDNNRRNGISIVSVDGALIDCPLISNTNGTLPSCGIDIEPNNGKDEANNIRINNAITFNNLKYGILISTGYLRGSVSKNVNVDIINHIDDQSTKGLYVVRPLGDYKKLSPIHGRILVRNPNWLNSKESISNYSNNKYSPILKIVK